MRLEGSKSSAQSLFELHAVSPSVGGILATSLATNTAGTGLIDVVNLFH
jgi:hypothetical protein